MKIHLKYQEDDGNEGSEFCDSIEEAIEHLEGLLAPALTFYHIGGYECLRDGTKEDDTIPFTIDALKEFAAEYDLECDYFGDDVDGLLEGVENAWNEYWNEGGGSGWCEL